MNKQSKNKSNFAPIFIVGCLFAFIFLFSSTHSAQAATEVYYSVGQNIDDHKTGTPTITISGGVATFSVAQTAVNMGVGDKISYGYANATTTAYISGKISSTTWNIVTTLGAQPVATTTAAVLKISHVFDSLANALPSGAGGAKGVNFLNTTDLVAGNYVLNIPCYYDSGADTATVEVNGWTTGLNNFIKIYTPNNINTEVNQSQRHSGVWISNKYRLEIVNNPGIEIYTSYVKVDGLQVKISTNSTHDGIENRQGHIIDGALWASNNIIWGASMGYWNTGIDRWEEGTDLDINFNLYVWNNIIYGFKNGDNDTWQGAIGSNVGNLYAYNNTVYDCSRGFMNWGADEILKNNLAYNNVYGYTGGFSASSTNNLSGPLLNDAPGSNPQNTKTVSFFATSTANFHLLARDAGAKDHGVDLSGDKYLAFNTDIDGQAHIGTWDIGADEFVPMNISAVATSSVTASFATITWTTDENSTSTVRYGLTSAYGSATTSNVLTTLHSIRVTGLLANTTYHYRVESTDAFGNKATSTDKTFTTISAVSVYYSVGQNTFDHKTGTPTITISGGVATFSVAQTATNMGVGDKISYGYANATTTAYISGKISSTTWSVITRIGAQPTATTTANVLKISHVFNSLSAALPSGAGGAKGVNYLNTTDLVAGNYVLNIPCYYDSGPDTTNVIINNWTTGLNNYIRAYTPNNTVTEVNQSQRHSGKWDNNKYRLEVSNVDYDGVRVEVSFAKIDGLQIKVTNVGDMDGIYSETVTTGKHWYLNNIIWGVASLNRYASGIDRWGSVTDFTMYAYNNIIYGFKYGPGNSYQAGIKINGGNGYFYLYNNTIYDSHIGVVQFGGSPIVKNNLAYGNDINYNGSFNASSTSNLSGPILSGAPGSNPQNAKTVSFYSASTSTTANFHLLTSDVNAKDHGVDLSGDKYLAFSTDLDGQTRTGTWDIGADEFVPLNISAVATSSISTFTATISWTTDSLATSTVQYGLTTGYGLASSSSSFVTSHSINLHGLTSNSTYNFRVISTDAFGVTATSSDYTFKTIATGPAIMIYRSVGVGGENELASSTVGTLTIDASGNLIFSGISMPNRVGVGDAIVYDSNGDNVITAADDVVFISGRASNSNYTVKDQFGNNTAITTTGNDTWAVYRAYTSLAKAEASTNNTSILPSYDSWSSGKDLVAANQVWNIACYGDALDANTAEVDIDGWTTSQNNYVKVYTPYLSSEVGISQRHNGKWDVNKYEIQFTGNALLGIYANTSYVKIDGLQIKVNSLGGSCGGISSMAVNVGGLWASNNIVWGNLSDNDYSTGIVRWGGVSDFTMYAYNNIIYGFKYSSGNPWQAGIKIGNESSGYFYLYNNTIYDSHIGVFLSSGNAVVKNNLSYGNDINYNGPFNASSTNNLSGPILSGAPGSNPQNAKVVFFIASSTSNFHLFSSDVNAKNYGVDLSSDKYLPITTDIDGQTRTGIWDIGADEFVPLNISAVATSSISAFTATISWTTDNLATSTVQYGLTTSYGSASSSSSFVTSHTINLYSLISNSTYHFRVISTDAFGVSTTSSDYTFHTPDVSAPVIDSFTAQATSSSLTISIVGIVAHDNTAVTGYLVNELASTPSLSDSAWETTATSTYIFATPGSKTLYAWARDTAGNISSSFSAGVIITLPVIPSSGGGSLPLIVNTPPGIPTNFSIVSTSSFVMLSWANPVNADFVGVKLYRKTGVAPINQTDTLAALIYQGKGVSFIDKSSTTVGALYYYSIYSYDVHFNYSQSRTISFIAPMSVGTSSTIATTTIVTPIVTSNSTTTISNNNPASGTVTTLIGASSATTNQVTAEEAHNIFTNAQQVDLLSAEKNIYLKIIALVDKPLSNNASSAIALFIHFGTPTTRSLGAGERGGAIASFQVAYGYFPETEADWQDVIKIGNGRWPSKESVEALRIAKISFNSIYGRNANMNNPNDNAAVTVMAYGLRPAARNFNSEKVAIKTYRAIFHHSPATARAWDAVRAIAYSGAKK